MSEEQPDQDRLAAAQRLSAVSDALQRQGQNGPANPPAFAGPKGEPFGRQPKFGVIRRETRPAPAPLQGDQDSTSGFDAGFRSVVLRLLETLRRQVAELYRRINVPTEEAISNNDTSGDLRRFILQKDGGGDGDRNSEPSITYTVIDPKTFAVLGRNIPITGGGQRLVNATLKTYADRGIGYMDAGLPVVIWGNEKYKQSNCST